MRCNILISHSHQLCIIMGIFSFYSSHCQKIFFSLFESFITFFFLIRDWSGNTLGIVLVLHTAKSRFLTYGHPIPFRNSSLVQSQEEILTTAECGPQPKQIKSIFCLWIFLSNSLLEEVPSGTLHCQVFHAST